MRPVFLMLSALALTAVMPASAKAPAPLAAAVANAERPEEDRVRDGDRKPAALMAFAGIRPGTKIAELAPGGGYYTRLLSTTVGSRGYVYAVAGRPNTAVAAWARTHGNVSITVIKPGDALTPEPVDVVWTTLNYHDFKNVKVGDGDAAAVYNAAAFKALKPGGTYFIVDHQAAKGSGASGTSTLHRIEDAVVIAEVEAAGFKLAGRSDLLSHPDDNLAGKSSETKRGLTDQFVLRFVKPRR